MEYSPEYIRRRYQRPLDSRTDPPVHPLPALDGVEPDIVFNMAWSVSFAYRTSQGENYIPEGMPVFAPKSGELVRNRNEGHAVICHEGGYHSELSGPIDWIIPAGTSRMIRTGDVIGYTHGRGGHHSDEIKFGLRRRVFRGHHCTLVPGNPLLAVMGRAYKRVRSVDLQPNRARAA